MPLTLIKPKPRDLGDGFMVRRALPAIEARAVGPFVFLDEMGPHEFKPGEGLDVRPHPHIGLATVTYLFEGEIVHRDSLGFVQPIRPGDVNWMTAGKGIVHSERTGPELRASGHRVHGLQSWVALTHEAEETEPAFHHHPAATLPRWMEGGAELTLIAGTAFGRTSPVAVFSPIFYVALAAQTKAKLTLAAEHDERAVYVASGSLRANGEEVPPGTLALFAPGEPAPIEAEPRARAMLLGGADLGPRRMWWNFVASSEERMARAKDDWRAGRFAKVPGETEFIPLPEN